MSNSTEKEFKTAEELLDAYGSKVKPVYIELYDYGFYHSPTGIDCYDEMFIGRKKEEEQLFSRLDYSASKSGAYLVAGYRGMGKSSLVRRVIGRVKGEGDRDSWMQIKHGLQLALLFAFTWFFCWAIYSEVTAHFSFPPTWLNTSDKFLLKILSWLHEYVQIVLSIISFLPVFWLKFNHIPIRIKRWIKGYFWKRKPIEVVIQRIKTSLPSWLRSRQSLPTDKEIYRQVSKKHTRWHHPSWFRNRATNHPLVDIEISLSQDDLKEIDILRMMARQLLHRYSEFRTPVFSFRSTIFLMANIVFVLIAYWYIVPQEIVTNLNEFLVKKGYSFLKFSPFELLDPLLSLLTSITTLWLLWWVWKRLFVWLGFVNHFLILKRIRNLNDRLDSSISTEIGVTSTGLWKFGGRLNKRKDTPIATSKEVEVELLSIFQDIDRLKWPQSRPYLIFVFDELDKLQPGGSIGISEKEAGDAFLIHEDLLRAKSKSTASPRDRQETIGRILANLKQFFAGATAKFVFIAGREMYDASLADTSDRDALVGSIFDDVIYVPSFFKDDSASDVGGITGMTQLYLSRFLVPAYPFKPNKTIRSLDEYSIFLRLTQLDFNGISEAKLPYEAIGNLLFHPSVANKISQIKIEDLNLQKLKSLSEKDNRVQINCWKRCCEDQIKFEFQTYWEERKRWKNTFRKKISRFPRVDKLESNKSVEWPSGFVELLMALEDLSTIMRNSAAIEKKRKEHIKGLALLQNLVVYLIYRSNGSPKKISHLFEDLLTHGYPKNTKGSIVLSDPIADLYDSRRRLFLSFPVEIQYQINLIARLFRPHLVRTNTQAKHQGDKILVATTFIMDHILKFHATSFNWWNLEFIPDVISITSPPDIRDLVHRLINSLEQSAIRRATSGIFQFTFRKRYHHEISYLSKTNEQESAAFTFSLDESLAIKRHYKKRLLALIHQDSKRSERIKGEYDNSIGFLNTVLGDLHFYDQDFDEAIVYYGEAIQELRHKKVWQLPPQQFWVLIRDKLKLTLCYEHMRSSASVIVNYNELASWIWEYFTSAEHISRQNLGLFKSKAISNTTEEKRLNYSISLKNIVESLRLVHQPLIARLASIEKESISGVSHREVMDSEAIYYRINESVLAGDEDEDFLNHARYHLNVGMVLYFKNGSALFDIHAVKSNERNATSLLLLEGIQGKSKNAIIPSSAYLEYFKALFFALSRLAVLSPLPGLDLQIDKRIQNPPASPISSSQVSQTKTPVSTYQEKWFKALARQNNLPSESTALYEFLNSVANEITKNPETISHYIHAAVLIIKAACFDKNQNWTDGDGVNQIKNRDVIISLAEIIARIGDCEFSAVQPNEGTTLRLDIHQLRNAVSLNLQPEMDSRVLLVLECFGLATKLQQQAGQHKFHAFSIRKILMAVHDLLRMTNSPIFTQNIDMAEWESFILRELLGEKLKAISFAFGNTSRPQYMKNRILFGKLEQSGDNRKDKQSREYYLATSGAAEIAEANILASKILIHLKRKAGGVAKELYQHNINPTSHVSGMFERQLELEFKSQLNDLKFKSITANLIDGSNDVKLWEVLATSYVRSNFKKHASLSKTINYTKSNRLLKACGFLMSYRSGVLVCRSEDMTFPIALKRDDFEIAAFCILDSIECLIESLRIFNLLADSYIQRLSFLAMLNIHLGKWCIMLKKVTSLIQDEKIIVFESDNTSPKSPQEISKRWTSLREQFLPKNDLRIDDPKYYYLSATEAYKKLIELHSGGNYYKKILSTMYYLEDDFGDQHSHFSAAAERSIINNFKIVDRIEELNLLTSFTTSSNPESYSAIFDNHGLRK